MIRSSPTLQSILAGVLTFARTMQINTHRDPLVVFTGLWLACMPVSCSLESAERSNQYLPKVRVAPDRIGFVTEDGKPFVPFGVNYFRPGTGWAPQVWKQFDAEATRRDFAILRELGANCVRVFLTYGSFYNTIGQLSQDGLAKFDKFLELAQEAGLYVHPTGPDHWEGMPEWSRHGRLIDDEAIDAIVSFWKLFAERYRGRNVIFAYDLLNEPEIPWSHPKMREKWNNWLEHRYGSVDRLKVAWEKGTNSIEFGRIDLPQRESTESRVLLDYQLFREHLADEWTRRQVAAIKSVDKDALVTVGLIQWSVPFVLAGPWQYSGFRPARQAQLLDFLEIHFYPLATGFYEYTGPDAERMNLAYLEAVVREVAAPGKPVVLAEFGWYGGGKLTINGGRHPPATEAQQAEWCRRAIEVSQGWCCGWLHWGLYDHPDARDVTQLIGLFTADGRIKEWGRTFRDMATRIRSAPMQARRDLARPTMEWEK
ncbi:MAG: glycoside hydrolase family 5 protein, partial [Verrucomicrobiae bacterium]|nr:glycoside hydrolase family 5 protein [Verrucomicrobiae bacterium]